MAELVSFRAVMELRAKADPTSVMSALALARRVILCASVDKTVPPEELAKQSLPMFIDEKSRIQENTLRVHTHFASCNWAGTDNKWFALINSLSFDESKVDSLSQDAKEFCEAMRGFGVMSRSFQRKLFLCASVRICLPAQSRDALNNVHSEFKRAYSEYVKEFSRRPVNVLSVMSVLITSTNITKSDDYSVYPYTRATLGAKLRELEKEAFEKKLIPPKPFEGKKAEMLARYIELKELLSTDNGATNEARTRELRRNYQSAYQQSNALRRTAVLPIGLVLSTLPVNSQVQDKDLPRCFAEASARVTLLQTYQQ